MGERENKPSKWPFIKHCSTPHRPHFPFSPSQLANTLSFTHMVCTHKLLSLSSAVTLPARIFTPHQHSDTRGPSALPFSTLTHPSLFVVAIFNPVVFAERRGGLFVQ